VLEYLKGNDQIESFSDREEVLRSELNGSRPRNFALLMLDNQL
jgi:hypothetical protein